MEFRVENFNLIITFDVGSLYLTGTLGCNFYNLGTCFMELATRLFILRTISVTSSLTPGIVENSRRTPSILIDVTAQPSRGKQHTAQTVAECKLPKPRSSGSTNLPYFPSSVIPRFQFWLFNFYHSRILLNIMRLHSPSVCNLPVKYKITWSTTQHEVFFNRKVDVFSLGAATLPPRRFQLFSSHFGVTIEDVSPSAIALNLAVERLFSLTSITSPTLTRYEGMFTFLPFTVSGCD